MSDFRQAIGVLGDRRMLAAQAGFALFSIVEHGAWLALLLYAFDNGGVGEAGLVAFALLIPAAIFAPLAAAVTGRMSASIGLGIGYTVQAITCAATGIAMYTEASSTVVYLAGALFTMALTLSRPTVAAVLPAIAPGPAELTAANSISGTIETIGAFLGPATAGLLLVTRSPADVFTASSAMLALAVLLSLTIGATPHDRGADETAEDDDEGPIAEILGGLTLLRTEREPRLVVLLLAVAWLVIGALEVALVAVAVDELGRGEATAGLLASALGVGGLIGAGFSFTLVGRQRLSVPVAIGLLGIAVPIVALAVTDSLILVVILLGFSGAGDALSDIAGRTLLQGLAAQDTMARVFGVLEGLATAALAVGSVGFSLIAVAAGLTTALLVTGAILPVLLLIWFRRLAEIDRSRPTVDPKLLAFLRQVPIFAPLPAFRAEQLLVNLRPIEFSPTQTVFEDGMHGDRLYLVAEGSAVVELGDREVVHRSGGFFGEIALLKHQPRMATVRAGPHGLFAYTLERQVFLDAISRDPRSRIRTLREADRRIEED